MYMLYFFKINSFFSKALLDPMFPVIAMQIFDFKNSIIAIELQTRFQKSWDTVQIVNKNRMQWCGSLKFQYFIQNTT